MPIYLCASKHKKMIDLTKSEVLITGGSDGIGKSLARRFAASGSRVLITGRHEDKLKAAASGLHGVETLVNDIGDASARTRLAKHVMQHMPGINILINNAGIQRRVPLAEDQAPWRERQEEIDILLSAPVHLNHLLVPFMLKHGQPSMIVNVSSGGAFIPQVFAPVYSACKAAVHSYSTTLRHSLQNTTCRVVELIPPAVQTSLSGAGNSHGADLETFADAVFSKLIEYQADEIGYGPTANLQVEISGQSIGELFSKSSARFPVKTYHNCTL